LGELAGNLLLEAPRLLVVRLEGQQRVVVRPRFSVVAQLEVGLGQ